MRTLDIVTFALVIAGALNWLLVGLFRFDLVAAVVGRDFGEVAPLNAALYVLVGLSGLYQLIARAIPRPAGVGHERPTRLYPR